MGYSNGWSIRRLPHKLPRRPSILIRQALSTIRVVENKAKKLYRPCHIYWLATDPHGVRHASIAGMLMAFSDPSSSRSLTLHPMEYDQLTRSALYALEKLAGFRVGEACELLGASREVWLKFDNASGAWVKRAFASKVGAYRDWSSLESLTPHLDQLASRLQEMGL